MKVKAFIVDLLAWSVGVVIMLSFLFWAANAKAAEPTPEELWAAPLTFETRIHIVTGVLMGIDMSLAITSKPGMTNEQALRLADTLNRATEKCVTVGCVVERIGGSIRSIRESMKNPKSHIPLDDIIR